MKKNLSWLSSGEWLWILKGKYELGFQPVVVVPSYVRSQPTTLIVSPEPILIEVGAFYESGLTSDGASYSLPHSDLVPAN